MLGKLVMLSFLSVLLTIVMIVRVHQSTSGMGTGLTTYHIKETGHKVHADDAVPCSGSYGGRLSVVRGRRSFTVVTVYHIVWVLSPYVEVYSLCGMD